MESIGNNLSKAAVHPNGLLVQPEVLDQRLRMFPFDVDVWCPVAISTELKRQQMLTVKILGTDYVVFRSATGVVSCLENRCPHRGVALSLGEVKGEHIQCSYHGWRIGGDGLPAGIKGPCVKTLIARESSGVVWVFVGDSRRVDKAPLPAISPFAEKGSTDILVRKRANAHWSLLFDNGIDLFHQHLHRDIPFFFRTSRMSDFGASDGAFYVRYDASMTTGNLRRSDGDLKITVRGGHFKLDLNGFPIIHSFVTPHSADGRDLLIWWFISFSGNAVLNLLTRFMKPFFAWQISRGFDQDIVTIESEQRALERSDSPQYEWNPAIHAGHQFLFDYILQKAHKSIDPSQKFVELNTTGIVEETKAGRLIPLFHKNGNISHPSLEDLSERLEGRPTIRGFRYFHVVVMDL